jgi:hypothetical protein
MAEESADEGGQALGVAEAAADGGGELVQGGGGQVAEAGFHAGPGALDRVKVRGVCYSHLTSCASNARKWRYGFSANPWCKSITYAEGFAGAGIYEGGEPGSPVIAADAFLRRREYLDSKPLNMVLVEEDSRRLQRLKEEMAPVLTRYGEPPTQLRIRYEEGSCWDKLLPALQGAGAMGAPVFAFLDSWGRPDVPFDLVRSIARQPAGEVRCPF